MEQRINLQKKNNNARCPYCHDSITLEDANACVSCHALYHRDCIFRCVTLGCPGPLTRQRSESPKLSISPRATEQKRSQEHELRLSTRQWHSLIIIILFVAWQKLPSNSGAVSANAILELAALFVCLFLFMAIVQPSPDNPEERPWRGRR